jgi:TonB family protein
LRFAIVVRQQTNRERAVVVPESKPFHSEKTPSTFERPSASETPSNAPEFRSSNVSRNLDENAALLSLKELIAAGNHRLDPILTAITDAAQKITGATGAALGMWKEGAMVCRARSGETAPALGARLSTDTGISGECLRTGRLQNCADTENDPFVDVEVCRTMGLRSIVVLPIQGWRGINGILEIFSTKPVAFNPQQISFLEQLAALAERARASQPHGASSSMPKLASDTEKSQPSSLLPASDRVGDVALAFVGTRSRPLVLGALSIAAIALLAFVIWLGWRGPSEVEGKAHATDPGHAASVASQTAPAVANDPVWKADPGGEPLLTLSGKPSAGSPVTFAAKVDAIPEKRTRSDRSSAGRVQGDQIPEKRTRQNQSPLLADLADKVAADVAVPQESSGSQAGVLTNPRAANLSSGSANLSPSETASPEPPVAGESTNQPAVEAPVPNGLSGPSSLPRLSEPVSQGVSGGQLMHRVLPDYPVQALQLHLEGTVVLDAIVMEDGTVTEVKKVEGPATLVPSAIDAVKHWRYKPFELDGKPVKSEIRINVEFKFPKASGHE